MYVRSLENRAFMVLVLLVTVAFAWTLGGFLLPVFWATVLAILFTPTFHRVLEGLGGRRSLASFVTLLGVVVVVIAPIIGIGVAVTGEAVGVYSDVADGTIDLSAEIAAVERMLPRVTDQAARFNIDLDRAREAVSQAALTASRTVASQLLNVGQQAVHFTLMLAVTLYVLFFFMRDGDPPAGGADPGAPARRPARGAVDGAVRRHHARDGQGHVHRGRGAGPRSAGSRSGRSAWARRCCGAC